MTEIYWKKDRLLNDHYGFVNGRLTYVLTEYENWSELYYKPEIGFPKILGNFEDNYAAKRAARKHSTPRWRRLLNRLTHA